MSLDLVEAIDEAIDELQEEEEANRKNIRSAIAKACWANSKKLQAKMSSTTAKRYGINRNDTDQNDTTEVKTGWQHPNASWRSKKATSKQINFICKLPYRGPIPYSRGEAHDIISKYCKSKLSTTIKNIKRKFVTTVFHQSDDSGITIDDSDSNSENAPYSATEKAKLERQLWRESLG